MARVAPKVHAVILAGGAGERFWPASRRAHPKFFLALTDGESLIRSTVRRARACAGPGRVWVVCGEDHRRGIRAETGLPANRVIVEPRRRDTAMAIATAAHRVVREDPEAVMAVLPADHRVPDLRAFRSAIRRGAHAAAEAGVLVALGVRPTRPEIGYGYIQVGDPAPSPHRGLRCVRRFVEKPNAATARRYLKRGDYLWNAGIFVWSAKTILDEIETHAPDLHRALAPLRSAGRLGPKAIRAAYRRAPSVSVDFAIMEKSRRAWTLPVRFHWSDIGSWESLAVELGVRPGRSQVIDGDVFFDDSGGNLVSAKGRVVALVGVEGLAVVDTGDAILVTRLDRSPELRQVVAKLKASGRSNLT